MKKILALVLLTSSFAIADHHDPEGYRWGVGARAGVAAFVGEHDTVGTTRVAGAAVTTGAAHYGTFSPGITSFQGGAFLEAAYRSCDWSIGALFDVNGDTLKKTFACLNDQILDLNPVPTNIRFARLKAPLHVGADVRGGLYFGDALWYVLIGGEGIRYEFSHNINNQLFPFSITAPATLCFTDKFWKGALRVGTGMECYLADCLKLKLEYRFLWAGKRNITRSTDVVGIDQVTYTVTVSDCLKFRQHVTALMLSYEF